MLYLLFLPSLTNLIIWRIFWLFCVHNYVILSMRAVFFSSFSVPIPFIYFSFLFTLAVTSSTMLTKMEIVDILLSFLISDGN